MNLGHACQKRAYPHLDFDIVSNFELRISYFSYRNTLHEIRNCPLHLSRTLYKSALFMQNKPNFDKGQNKPNPLYKKDLRKFFTPSDNEKRTQNKPNLLDTQMNITSVKTKDYENEPLCRCGENKPNQTQFQTQLTRLFYRRQGNPGQ